MCPPDGSKTIKIKAGNMRLNLFLLLSSFEIIIIIVSSTKLTHIWCTDDAKVSRKFEFKRRACGVQGTSNSLRFDFYSTLTSKLFLYSTICKHFRFLSCTEHEQHLENVETKTFADFVFPTLAIDLWRSSRHRKKSINASGLFLFDKSLRPEQDRWLEWGVNKS